MKPFLSLCFIGFFRVPAFRIVRSGQVGPLAGDPQTGPLARDPLQTNRSQDSHLEGFGREHEQAENATLGDHKLVSRTDYVRVAADMFRGQLKQLLHQAQAQHAKGFLFRNSDGSFATAETMGLCVSLLVVVYFVSAKCCTRGVKTKKLNEMRSLIKMERQKFNSFVEEMLGPLQAIEENSSDVAECRFREKYRALVHVVQFGVRENNESTNAILISRNRKFMLLWMQAFEDCTLDPENNPMILCPPSRLSDPKRCVDIYSTILNAIEETEPDFAMAQMLNARKFHLMSGKGPSDEQDSWIAPQRPKCFPSLQTGREKVYPLTLHLFCLRIRVNSFWHASVIMLFLYGCGAAPLLHFWGKHVVAVTMDIAVCLLFILLVGVDKLEDHVILEQELSHIKAQKVQVEAMLKNVKKWIENYDRVCMLWKQTLTKLDLMEEMAAAFFRLWNTTKKEDFDLGWDPLREVNEKLQAILTGMGTSREYLHCSWSEEWLAKANEHMQESVLRISRAIDAKQWEQMVQFLGNFFGYLKVRIKGANDLGLNDGSFFKAPKKPKPYLVGYMGQVGQRDEVKMRTKTAPETCSPKWNQEFEYPVDTEEFITFEVRSGEELLGYCTLPLRESPGEWQVKRSRLRDSTGKAGKATLDVEYFFGDCVRQFLTSKGKKGSAAAAAPWEED